MKMVFDWGSLGVPLALSVVGTVITMYIVSNKYMVPLIEDAIDGKLQDVDKMMKAAGSALGKKSGESRELKKLDKAMMGDIMDRYPEIEMALEYFSPETAEMMKKHPERALALISRWKPIIEEFMGIKAGDAPAPWDY